MTTAAATPAQFRLRALFAAALAAVLALALWPLDQPPPLHTGWDKADHVAAFLALGLLGIAGWPWHRARVFAGLLAYGAAIELLQGLTTYRQADWRDFVADAVGAGLALVAARFVRRLRAARIPERPGG